MLTTMKYIKLFSLFAFIMLAGCKGQLAGHSSDMSQLVVGDGVIHVGRGEMTFDVKFPPVGKSPGLPFTCAGKVTIVGKNRGVGTKFRGPFKCTDGRKGFANMTVVEIGESKGIGRDECGNVFHVYAAIDELTIEELTEEYTEKIVAAGREFVDKCELQGGSPEHFDPII